VPDEPRAVLSLEALPPTKTGGDVPVVLDHGTAAFGH
jgi:hypothetical protein